MRQGISLFARGENSEGSVVRLPAVARNLRVPMVNMTDQGQNKVIPRLPASDDHLDTLNPLPGQAFLLARGDDQAHNSHSLQYPGWINAASLCCFKEGHALPLVFTSPGPTNRLCQLLQRNSPSLGSQEREQGRRRPADLFRCQG